MVKNNRRFTDAAAPPGGWKGDARESMWNIALPDTITCALCERELPVENYSPSAQKRLLSAIRQQGMGVLDDQQIARCDGCGTQSRPEIHCMTCNNVRPIDEFAHTQRQQPQPICLPCRDHMQLDQRDKELDKRDQLFSDHLAQHLKAGSPSQATEENSKSAPAVPETSGMTEKDMMKDSTPKKEKENTFKPGHRRSWIRADNWTGGMSSNSAIRSSPQNQPGAEDMQFEAIFEDDEEPAFAGSSYQW